MSGASLADDDLEQLRGLLTDDIERLAETLLGPRNKAESNSKTWAWGSKGSLKLTVRGSKKGLWNSFEGAGGGGPFDLICYAKNYRFPDAIHWARKWVGGALIAPRKLHPARDRTTELAKQQAEDAAAVRKARGLAHAADPIAGTLGATYLEETRGIPAPPGGWPDPVRYHAPTRSLLAVATLADGSVQAVQHVYLSASGGRRLGEEDSALPKITHGRLAGALVRLPPREDVMPSLRGALLLAEGPENGLTAWAATGCETWLVFGVGQFAKIELPADRRVILCRDDDRRFSQADKSVGKAVTGWRKAGCDVVVALPWADRRQDKSDINDVQRAHGAAGVLARILPHAPTATRAPRRRVSLQVARAQLDAAVSKFFADALAFDPQAIDARISAPPVHAIRVNVGVGKSHAARHHAVELVAALRVRGDKRTVVLAVPTHRLGVEQVALLQALPRTKAASLTVAVWRGRRAPDPSHADFANPQVADDDKPTMCGNLNDVSEAEAHGLPVNETACRRVVKASDGDKVVHECPLYSTCSYQAQRRKRADIWLVAHEMLFTTKPATIGDVAAVVVDESAWQAALEGHEGKGKRMPLDALRSAEQRFQNSRDPDWLVLQHHRERALRALAGSGPVTRAAMAAEGLTAANAAEARALELQRLVDPKIHPGMTRSQRIALLKSAEGNKAILQAAKFWSAMEALLEEGGPAASGWAIRDTVETPDGPSQVVRLRGRKPVRAGWDVPTLLIDALLNVDLVQPIWPQVEMTADIEADAPHQHVRQVIDRSYSKARIEPLDDEKAAANPDEATRRTKNLREARAILFREARKHRGGRMLAVAQKGVREALEALGPLPRNLVLAHHNAVAGRDEWGDVDGLVVLGRTAPSPGAVERMAEALTGAAVPAISGWYPRAPACRELDDGQELPTEADRHPDPLCEAIRWEITEGELVQIIGRGRGVNRTAAAPLDVLVMTDVPLPLPIHQTLSSADLAPSTADRMLAECGFAFENPAHAALACPSLWPNREAAKKAFERAKLGTFSNRESLIGECPQLPPEWRRIDYRRQGQGQGVAVAWFDPLLVANAKASLEKRIGALAWCQTEGEAPGDEQAPSARRPASPPAVRRSTAAVDLSAQPAAVSRPTLHAIPPADPDVPPVVPTHQQRPLLLLFRKPIAPPVNIGDDGFCPPAVRPPGTPPAVGPPPA